MITATLLQLVAAFFLGCILTEIRSIVRMRQLRGDLGVHATPNEYAGRDAISPEPGIAGSPTLDLADSLRNLSLQLTAEAPVKRSRERVPVKS